MKINLGIAPIAWSNDDMPDLGGDTPIETCLFEAKSAGFKGIELGGKFPRNPRTIKYLLDKFNLELPGGWYGAHLNERSIEEEWQAMQNQIELHKLINSSVFIFADVSGSIQGEPKIPLSKNIYHIIKEMLASAWSGLRTIRGFDTDQFVNGYSVIATVQAGVTISNTDITLSSV